MAIQIKCPNGHKLTAKDSHAGKSGRCPVCQCAIQIPKPEAAITDSAVLDILGNPDPLTSLPPSASSILSSVKPSPIKPTHFGRPVASTSLPSSKTCPSCERDIDIGYHICPHCHKYLSAPGEM